MKAQVLAVCLSLSLTTGLAQAQKSPPYDPKTGVYYIDNRGSVSGSIPTKAITSENSDGEQISISEARKAMEVLQGSATKKPEANNPSQNLKLQHVQFMENRKGKVANFVDPKTGEYTHYIRDMRGQPGAYVPLHTIVDYTLSDTHHVSHDKKTEESQQWEHKFARKVWSPEIIRCTCVDDRIDDCYKTPADCKPPSQMSKSTASSKPNDIDSSPDSKANPETKKTDDSDYDSRRNPETKVAVEQNQSVNRGNTEMVGTSHGAINPATGEFYAPAGGGNLVGTRDGTLFTPAGSNGYINTRTGQFVPAH